MPEQGRRGLGGLLERPPVAALEDDQLAFHALRRAVVLAELREVKRVTENASGFVGQRLNARPSLTSSTLRTL